MVRRERARLAWPAAATRQSSHMLRQAADLGQIPAGQNRANRVRKCPESALSFPGATPRSPRKPAAAVLAVAPRPVLGVKHCFAASPLAGCASHLQVIKIIFGVQLVRRLPSECGLPADGATAAFRRPAPWRDTRQPASAI